MWFLGTANLLNSTINYTTIATINHNEIFNDRPPVAPRPAAQEWERKGERAANHKNAC